MRKWTYLVAALLMSGATATFTSCIDTEEPYGIEQMRTAKAEFYSAQAAYKLAEVAYLDSQTAIQAELLKQEQIETQMKELIYQQTQANSAAEIEAINMRLAELKAAHEVTMKNQETALAEAEIAYQTALRDLDLVISRLNSDYTAEYARLLGNITANRAERAKLNADLMAAKLSLNEYSERKLDTTSVRNSLVRSVEDAQKTLDYLENQRDLLVKINGADNETRIALANELNTQIRTDVETYNQSVKELQAQNDKLASANQAVTDKENELLNEYIPKFRETKEEIYAVDPVIQNKFIQAVGLTSEDFVTVKELTTYQSASKENYYTLAEGEYTLTVEDTDVPGGSIAITANNNTTSQIVVEIANLMSMAAYNSSSISTPAQEASVDAELPSKKAWLAEIGQTYSDELKVYTDAKTDYQTARDNFLADAPVTWYNRASAAIDSYNSSDKKDADKDALISELKKYAPLREAYDGFVATTGTGDDEKKVYETLDRTNVEALAQTVLGDDPSIFTPTEDSSKGIFLAISNKLFGVETYSVPESVENEYNYWMYAGTPSFGGIFKQYYNAYVVVQEVLEAKAWKVLYEALRSDWVAYTTVQLGYQDAATTVAGNADLVALEKEAMDIENEIAILEQEVGTNAGLLLVGFSDNDYKVMNITSASGTIIGGSLGTYITAMQSYYNSVMGGNTAFDAELAELEDKIESAQETLVQEQNTLAAFDAGGYKLTSSVSVEIGSESAKYITISSPTDLGGGRWQYTITYYNPDGTVKYEQYIIVDDPDFATNFDNTLTAGGKISVASDYLKVVIEAYEAKVENIQAQIDNLDAELLILQKELADFMEVLSARFPDTPTE